MNLLEVVNARHSVRKYTNEPICAEKVNLINEYITVLNAESGLNVQFIVNESEAFNCFLSRYGKFSNVKNYFAMVGKKGKTLQERIGYFGEKLVLYCQSLGLNTCWVGLSYKKVKNAYKVNNGEKLCVVISVGYGATQGMERKSKTIEQVSNADENSPKWFIDGVKCALKAPTAINQQKFYFRLDGENVGVKAGKGFYSKMDLGIVKYHFEIASGVKLYK